VHPTLGILARFQAVFYALSFSQSDGVPPPAPARVTQTVGWQRRRANAKPYLIRKFRFDNWLRNSIPFLAVAVFKVSGFGQYFFSKQIFKFSSFSFGSTFSAGISSGWFCPVAEIGFKVFGLRFGSQWF